MTARLKLWKIYRLRRAAESFDKMHYKGFPVWLLAIVAAIGLGTAAAFGVSAITGQTAPSGPAIFNPAFAGVSAGELPLVVDITPENLNINEETQSEVFVSLFNPKDFDVTKNLVLDYRCAAWNNATNVWGSFGSYVTLVTYSGVTVHPKDTVSLKVPFSLNTTTIGAYDESATEDKLLCQFKLSTSAA